MCRLLAYKGPPVILDDLLYEPEHSIINQSFHATEMEEPLNGDGFGVGWYARHIEPEPAVFTSVRPAWNNRNLQYITPKISSDCVFAHVRAASVGAVTKLNCHPFHCHNFLMMHNGGIDNFQQIRRPLLAELSDTQFHNIQGQTDSEHIFALFLEHLNGRQTTAAYLDSLKATVDDIHRLMHETGLEALAGLNILITDGKQFVGSRYKTESYNHALSLYFAKGEQLDGVANIGTQPQTDEERRAILFVSERLNSHAKNWNSVPQNQFFTVDEQSNLEFTAV